MRIWLGLGALCALVACTPGQSPFGAKVDSDAPAAAANGTKPQPRPTGFSSRVTAAKPSASARTAEQFDTTTAAERQAAAATPVAAAEKRLGTTIASLGNPADPGFWAETPLVSSVTQGRLEYPGTGKSVAVELRPIAGPEGAGTRVSLPAFRVLEAPLTALPELVVYAGG